MVLNISGSVRPETESQAAAWERVKQHALEFGLCHADASQLAWGHSSGGFSTIHPPRPCCAALILRLPVAKPNGWRTVRGVASTRPAWAALNVNDSAPGAPGAGRALIDAKRARGTNAGVSE